MIPIRFLGFQPIGEFECADTDVLALATCIRNGWSLENQDIWLRRVGDSTELAVVLSYSRDLQALTSLVRIDSILDGLRERKWQLGEIKPASAKYALFTIKDKDAK